MSQELTFSDWREAIRKRPAMYAGSTYIQGFIHLLKSVTTHSLSALEAGRVSFEITGKMSGKFTFIDLKNAVKENINEDLRLCDFAILNALSENYEFILFDKKETIILKQIYYQGVLESGTVEEKEIFADSLELKFKLDESIWELFRIEPELIIETFKEVAFLNKTKIFEINYSVKNEACRVIYSFENGLRDKIEVEKNKGLGSTIFDTWFEFEHENFFVEAAFGFREYSVDEPYLKSYTKLHK